MGENPCHSSCVNRSSTRSPTSRAQVSTSSPPPGDLCTPAFQIAEQLNGVYEKRIAEIEQDADGDARLKEELYIEWIEMLRQVNKTLIVNIQEMERETSERLVLLQRKVGTNCRQDSELNKYRNDVSTLIRLVRNGRNGDWNVNKFQFETITDRDIFGNEESYCDPTIKPEAEATNLPCGADEKANFECQKAKCNNLCGVRVVERTPTGPCTPKMSIKSSESSATDVSDVSRPGEQFSNRETTNTPNCGSSNVYNISLPDDEAEEEVFKCLKEEFLQFFELRRNFDQNADEQRRAIKEQRDRLVEMVEKLMKSFFEAQSKLKLYRRELIVLENPQSDRTLTNCSDVDSGICSDSDVDVKIINSVRGRFGCLMEENQRLIREQQTNQIQYQEVICRAIGKAELLDKASKALREIAEVLSSAICQTIAYDQLFTDCQSTPVNPFVEAVEKLIENLEEKDNMIDELKKQISMKTNQKLECGSEPPPLTTDLCDAKESV